jgi:hypothetical protein
MGTSGLDACFGGRRPAVTGTISILSGRTFMAHLFTAYIPPEHYEIMRGILHGNCPDTYDQWIQFYVTQIQNIERAGHTREEVQIDPDEFSDYVTRNAEERSLTGLDNFAAWKRRMPQKV